MVNRRGLIASYKYILFCSFLTISLVSSIDQKISTFEPRGIEHTTAAAVNVPTASSIITHEEGIGLYRLTTNGGATCILMKADALVEVKYKIHSSVELVDSYIPDKATVNGNCQHEDSATMTISWSEYVLLWEFAKTPGGEHWYVDNVELTVSTNIPRYYNIKARDSHIKLIYTQMLFPTPIEKSYFCDESIVQLRSKDPEGQPQILSGTLYFRAFQLQPFMDNGSSFGQSFECNTQLGFRTETVLIAVGSTLAIAVLITVTGYGIFRYFKKVNTIRWNRE